MQTLKFLGRGSAFNIKEGNTCAYYTEDGELLLIDCGENIFEKILEKSLLNNIEKVHVLITHLNSDHVGSLSSLIYYCHYIKKIKVTAYYPNEELFDLLKLMGHTDKEYEFVKMFGYESITKDIIVVDSIQTEHIETIKCYSYIIKLNNKVLYYSGDSSDFFGRNIYYTKMAYYTYDEIYQDVSSNDYEGNVHLSFKKLCESAPKEYRRKVYAMHIDSDKLIDKLKEEGFNVVELN